MASTIATAQSTVTIGNLNANGSVSIGQNPNTTTVVDNTEAYINGELVVTDNNSTARVDMNNGDGMVTVGTNMEATMRTGPGYLVIADGDRIDFEFKPGIPYAIEMDCYIVRPHPLQTVNQGELIRGSIIRDDDGSYVLGRGGRIDVTVNRKYLDYVRDFDRKADDGNRRRYSDGSQPDRVHTLKRDDRFEGCGGAAGLIAAIPQTCGVNTGSRIGSVIGAVGAGVAAIASGGGSSSSGGPSNGRKEDPPASGSSSGSGSSSSSGGSSSSSGSSSSGGPGIPSGSSSSGGSSSSSSGGKGGSGSSGGSSSSGASGGKGGSGSSGGKGDSGSSSSSGGKGGSGSSGGKGDECGGSGGYKPKDPKDPPASPVKGESKDKC